MGAILLASCAAALPEKVVVHRVIDGDTVEISRGRLVRYIGIDTPEVRRRVGMQWVMSPEPMGLEALALNRRLVEGKEIRCEYDVQTHDRFGRMLAYVYVGETMVNAELLKTGLAQPLTIPPNVRYAERFRALADEARRSGRGLWGEPR